MKRICVKLVAGVLALLGAHSVAFAYAVPVDQVICVVESLGEEEAEAWSKMLADQKNEPTDAQYKQIGTLTQQCADKYGWSEDESKLALQFNLALLGATAIEEKLRAAGLDPVKYESVLENRSEAELTAILEDPENHAAMADATDMLSADLGNDVSEDIAGALGSYIGYLAQAQLIAMQLKGAAE